MKTPVGAASRLRGRVGADGRSSGAPASCCRPTWRDRFDGNRKDPAEAGSFVCEL